MKAAVVSDDGRPTPPPSQLPPPVEATAVEEDDVSLHLEGEDEAEFEIRPNGALQGS